MTQPFGASQVQEPPPPPGKPWRSALAGVLTIVAIVVIKVVTAGTADGLSAADRSAAAEDGFVERERSIKSEEVFGDKRLADELRLLRRAIRRSERVRNLTILRDGNMASYTRQGPRFYWIETDGKTIERLRVREYPSELDPDIDLEKVRAVTPRRLLIEAEIKYQPRIWKLDALVLTPHPNDPDELMWTAKWVDPEPFALYAAADGSGVSKAYPPLD
ncbi:MAG: hypothetical protein JHD16_17485 [Solirubrobacteraceae bacterium]|nr:hypothetical protein [Solirubrobacteraceae bacterium]